MTKQNNAVESLASQRIKGILPKKYHMEYRSGAEELVEENSLKEVENIIRAAGENMEIPESLSPENINRKLEFLRWKKKRNRRIMVGILGGILFALLLAVLLLV
jgi:pantothenate kinase